MCLLGRVYSLHLTLPQTLLKGAVLTARLQQKYVREDASQSSQCSTDWCVLSAPGPVSGSWARELLAALPQLKSAREGAI